MQRKFPVKYQKVWKLCQPFFQDCRPGDKEHCQEITFFILDYSGKLAIDKDILVPVAMMHDIGHAAILPEHFIHITGPNKVTNGKLVHMLSGAKIAKDILAKAGYDEDKSREIVEIISMHDWDQLDREDWREMYDSSNKKAFHDFDCLDRYNERRISSFVLMYKNIETENKKGYILEQLRSGLDGYFYDEIKQIAEYNLKKFL